MNNRARDTLIAEADAPAACLYSGKVMHARLKPVAHRFSYRMAATLIDIDRLPEAANQSPLFSVDRFNLVSFHQADFGKRDCRPLRHHIEELLREAGLSAPAKIRLLCYPRVFGYTFNPLSVYYCTDATGALSALIYEVKNTFGEQHTYVQPVKDTDITPAGIRQEADKLFYVSPFLDMTMRYHFRLKEPGPEVSVRILETDPAGPILAATFFGHRRSLDTRNLFLALLQTCGIAWKVTAGIHFEALKLWLKGLKPRLRRPHGMTHSFPERRDRV